MNRLLIVVVTAFLISGACFAQEPLPVEPNVHVRVMDSFVPEPMAMMLQEGPGGFGLAGKIDFIGAEMWADSDPVKSAPYTATAVSESTQTLGDGNRITNKSAVFLARDGQGRTRRERTLGSMGPLHVEAPKMVFINDPVAHVNYILQPDEATATVVKHGPGHDREFEMMKPREGSEREKIKIITSVNGHVEESTVAGEKVTGEKIRIVHGLNDEGQRTVTHEDLGTQQIEGVTCQGKREKVTIAAGAIGNDRPIEMVSESWYSPDLHATVLRKHTDPRFGETVYRLTNIKLGEPDAALFQVPSNFKTVDHPSHMIFQRRLAPPAPGKPSSDKPQMPY